ncbi:MAG: hypothetical protein HY741_02415 [Chloroflexi bacterium]|nr:hypothetical protein [Chloroflexota bacterium]
MYGVQAAVLGITCLVALVMLLTAPLWMRALTAMSSAIWRRVAQTDSEIIVPDTHTDVVDGEFREVNK